MIVIRKDKAAHIGFPHQSGGKILLFGWRIARAGLGRHLLALLRKDWCNILNFFSPPQDDAVAEEGIPPPGLHLRYRVMLRLEENQTNKTNLHFFVCLFADYVNVCSRLVTHFKP